jgi:primosomal protein N' (replication factor Y)
MPEIALTAQFLDRFAERFGVRPAEWHSQLTPRLRARTWAAVAAAKYRSWSARARRCFCLMPISA